jgi:hypothetical protein
MIVWKMYREDEHLGDATHTGNPIRHSSLFRWIVDGRNSSRTPDSRRMADNSECMGSSRA